MSSELWLADPFGADFLGCALLGFLDMGVDGSALGGESFF
jgi:hypothetical protein